MQEVLSMKLLKSLGCVFVLGVSFFTPSDTAAQEVVRDFRSPRVRDYAVVVDEKTLTKQWLAEQAKALLARQHPKPELFRLTAGTLLVEVTHSLGHGKPPANKTIEDVLKEYGPPRGRLGRVISLSSGALLSYRDREQYSEEILWGPGDPTQFNVAGMTYRLLHFHLVDAGLKGRYFIHFYFVRPRPLSLGNCVQLLRRLQSLVEIKNVTVSVRTRPWFLEDFSFPDRYPFQADLTIPSRGQLLLMSHMSCIAVAGDKVNCAGNNIVP